MTALRIRILEKRLGRLARGTAQIRKEWSDKAREAALEARRAAALHRQAASELKRGVRGKPGSEPGWGSRKVINEYAANYFDEAAKAVEMGDMEAAKGHIGTAWWLQRMLYKDVPPPPWLKEK